MRAIRALVVDDEPIARRSLALLVQRDAAFDVIAECGSGAEALSVIRDTQPDLVFLDVEMPDFSGFQLLEMMGDDACPTVVFVTAYETYALRAFEARALDYLLKPFDDERFKRTLDRVKERIAGERRRSPVGESVVVKTAGQVSFLKLADIDWIESANYYSRLHAGTASHLLRRSLAELERELDSTLFCRIHRSAIVQLNRVRALEINPSGEYDVLLNSGIRLPLSRRHRRQLQVLLGARSEARPRSRLRRT
jgi:two-component system LytT family response regulator